MIIGLFGTNPDPKTVATSDIPSLAHHAKSRNTKELARRVAIVWCDMSPKGHLYQSSSNTNSRFAGQDDLIAWRKWGDGVSVTLSEIGKTQPS